MVTVAPWKLPEPVSGANRIKLKFTMLGTSMTPLTNNKRTVQDEANEKTIEDAIKAIIEGIRHMLPGSFRENTGGPWPTTFAESSLVLPDSARAGVGALPGTSVDVTITIPVPSHENIGQLMSTLYNKSLPCMKPQNPHEWICAACFEAYGMGKSDTEEQCVGDAGQNLKNLAGSIAQSILYGSPRKSHSRSNPADKSRSLPGKQVYKRLYPGTKQWGKDINIVIRSLATEKVESEKVWYTTPAPATSCTSEHARAILFADSKSKGKECLTGLQTTCGKAYGDPYGHRTCEKMYGRRRTSSTNVASQVSNSKYTSPSSVNGNAECHKGSCRCQLEDMSCLTAKGKEENTDCQVIGCVVGLQFPSCTKYDSIVSSADKCPGTGLCRDGMCMAVAAPKATPAPCPAATGTGTQVMMLKYTVSKVDFNMLTPELTASMVTAITEAVFQGLGRGYTKDDVAVSLKGVPTVVAEVTVTPKTQTACELLAFTLKHELHLGITAAGIQARIQTKVVAVLTKSDAKVLMAKAKLTDVKISSGTPKVVMQAEPQTTSAASSVARGVATALMAGAAGLVVTTQA